MTMTTKISYSSEWNEFTVKVWIDGKRHSAADYFTDDRQDARDTETAMLHHYAINGS